MTTTAQSQPTTGDLARSPQGARVRKLIQERAGLYFRDHEYRNVEATTCARMEACGIDDPEAYVRLLEVSQEEFCALVNALVIGHTYFLRNESQFAALRRTVLPALIEAQQGRVSGRPRLKLWSAGCSSGEEAYSLALTLHEVLPDASAWDIRVLATDVSTEALAAAEAGCYEATALRLVPPSLRQRYFRATAGPRGQTRYTVTDTLRAGVEFRYLNLLEDDFPDGVDVIFCRNVMIYFARPAMARLVQRFDASLNRPGHLFIGYSESLQGLSTDLRMVVENEGVYYVKEAATLPAHASAPVEPPPFADEPVRSPVAPSGGPGLAAIREAMGRKDYDRTLDLVAALDPAAPDALDAFYAGAFACTNRGDYAAARTWLERILTRDALFAPAYFLLGTVCLEEGQTDEAVAALRRALYLDGDLPMAYLALAAAHRAQEQPAAAIREYRRVIKLLSDRPPEQEVPYAGGFDHGTLLGICYNNIERLQNDL